MIIELMLDALYNVFSLLTSFIDIPSLPDGVFDALNRGLDYILVGAGILANYCQLDYLLILLGILVAIDIGLAIYHFVMWVIKKIPMLGIS